MIFRWRLTTGRYGSQAVSTRSILHLQYLLIILLLCIDMCIHYTSEASRGCVILYGLVAVQAMRDDEVKGRSTARASGGLAPLKWLPGSAVAHLPLIPTPRLTFASSFLRSSSAHPALFPLSSLFFSSLLTLSLSFALSLSLFFHRRPPTRRRRAHVYRPGGKP